MAEQTQGAVAMATDGDVAVITIDDGKANALSPTVIDEVEACLGSAERDAAAVVLAGRPGRFCAGFDLAVMQGDDAEAKALLRAGAELALRVYTAPVPVVVACTGHALAAGAILLMAADVRIGARGDFKIGLNEVAIGMPVPRFATELAHQRLSRRHLNAATSLARIYDPPAAVDAGYLDELADPDDLMAVTISRAGELGERLDRRAFEATRANLRGPLASNIRASLDADVAAFFVPASGS